MTVKTLLTAEIDDKSFKAFKAQYDAYEKSLKKLPEAWQQVTKSVEGSKKGYTTLLATLVAQNVQTRLHVQAQREADRLTMTAVDRWSTLARHSGTFAANVLRASRLMTEIGGLAGGGGLWGIDRMAEGVGARRRAAQGLGLRYGQQQSFELNYQRLVDTNSLLSGVSAALGTAGGRTALYGAGLRERDLRGNTGDVAAKLIPALARLADQTNPMLWGDQIKARHLDQWFGIDVEDMRRLHATSPKERGQIAASYARDQSALDLDPDAQQKWQDFAKQMGLVARHIRTVIEKDLIPLERPLEKLSSSFETAATAFLGSDTIRRWMDQAGKGLETFASYVGTPEFQKNVEDGVKAIGAFGTAVSDVVKWLSPADKSYRTAAAVSRTGGLFGMGHWFEPSTPAAAAARSPWMRTGAWRGATWGASPLNNPGNLRMPGQATGFAQFPTEQAGLLALARQLRLYSNRDHLDTISGIIGKYAPPAENDTAAYINDVTRRTGYRADQHLNLSDNATLAQLMAAITKHEGGKKDYPQKVIVEVLNNTGGNAIVTSNALSRQP
jgi:hypothetical protein